MKKLFLKTFLIILLITRCNLQTHSQTVPELKVLFKNVPVQFKENSRSYQQILATHKSENAGGIVFVKDGKEILKGDLKKGINRFLLTLPAVTRETKIVISAKINDGAAIKYPVTLVPPKKWEIYFVQFSHTDIGFTRPQSEIVAEQMRYIDDALDFCDQTDHMPDDSKFRWTCESSWITRDYLRSRPDNQITRLKKRIAEGRIEVTAMYANMSEITDENIMYDFLQPLKEINQSGIPVKLAMQNDVNGVAWCMPDYFKNTGVKYLNMGINEDRSVVPFDTPTCFWWESASGARLLAFRNDIYGTGTGYFAGAEFKSMDMLDYLANLGHDNYAFDRIGIQFSGYGTDNAPPSTRACEYIRKWNDKYEYPKLRLAVASEYFEYVEKNHGDKLQVYRNSWEDWWTDGFGSSSRETAEVRKTQNMKQAGEGLFAMVSMMGGKLSPALENKMDHISENIILFDEHTMGANTSISSPFCENSTKQWLMKGAYAWEALKKVTLLNDEALARFQQFLKKADFPVIYVMNSMGFPRSGHVRLFVDYDLLPVGTKSRIIDLSTGKEVPAQLLDRRTEGAYWLLEVSDMPAMGYKALKIDHITEEVKDEAGTNVEVLENRFYKLVINKFSGSISSLYDKELDQDLIDRECPYNIGQLVKETSAKRDRAPFIHTTISNVRVEPGINGSLWESVKIASDLAGFEKGTDGSPNGIELEIRLYKNVKKLEFIYMARKLIITDPEALFVAFPFSLPDSRIVFETVGGTLTQGQQLPGSSSSWNTAQNFVSIRGKKGQIIVVSDEIPLWQFSDFNMGKWERNPKQGKTWLYSYVMNNYWHTNFRAYQEGAFSWTYQLTSVADTTNSYATKFGWSERNPFLIRAFPAGENELKATVMETLKINGPANAMLINSRPLFNRDKGTILIHFRELEGMPAEVKLASAVSGQKISTIVEVNVLGKQIGQPVTSIQLKPFEVKFIEVTF